MRTQPVPRTQRRGSSLAFAACVHDHHESRDKDRDRVVPRWKASGWEERIKIGWEKKGALHNCVFHLVAPDAVAWGWPQRSSHRHHHVVPGGVTWQLCHVRCGGTIEWAPLSHESPTVQSSPRWHARRSHAATLLCRVWWRDRVGPALPCKPNGLVVATLASFVVPVHATRQRLYIATPTAPARPKSRDLQILFNQD